MRPPMVQWPLIAGFLALTLPACAGAGGDPSPADVPEGSAAAPPEVLPATSAQASPSPAPHASADLQDRLERWLARADADGNGTVTEAEIHRAIASAR
jgi:hypothetical protein